MVSKANDLIEESGDNGNGNGKGTTWDDLDKLINDKWDVAGSRLKEALEDIEPF